MSEFDSTTKHKQMHDTNEEDEIQLKYFSIDINPCMIETWWARALDVPIGKAKGNLKLVIA